MPVGLLVLGVVALFVLLLVAGSFFTVATSEAAVLQRFGKFLRVANAGLNFKMPLLDTLVARINLRVQQLDMEIETKTKDNVFVRIPVSIQYLVMPNKVYEAFYKLNDPAQQIRSYVFNVILGHVPKMNLDEAFLQQADIAIAVKSELDTIMADFGYSITKALVTDIKPDDKVKAAMNDINAAQREQVAASARGEAEKILKVKQAEADAESKALQGQGIANQRKAIITGLQESVELFQKSVPGASATDVLTLVMMTQYLDTLKEVGANSRTNTIMVPHSPGGLSEFFDQLRNAVILGMEKAQAPPAAPLTTAGPNGPGSSLQS
jgi:regulator of protease activity HflC (stomatin/prohibitin superfamily)